METSGLLRNVFVRNVLGLAALLILHFIVDYVSLKSRTGYTRLTPYLFVVLMYGWIVFHNRILFEKLFMQHRRVAYFGWTGLAMFLFSLNMYYIIITSFKVANPLAQIISFWIYTFAGLGVYVLWKSVVIPQTNSKNIVSTANENGVDQSITLATFIYMQDGTANEIQLNSIYYLESLENYVRIVTLHKPIIVRLTLKEAESKLPRPPFLRISRSHIANMNFVEHKDNDILKVGIHELKIGKVYKKYVEAYSK